MEADEVAAALDRYLHRDFLPVRSGGQVEGDALAGFRKLLLPLGPPLDATFSAQPRRNGERRNGEWYILSGKRGRPSGSGPRGEQTAKQLGLESTLRSRGRPAKESQQENNATTK